MDVLEFVGLSGMSSEIASTLSQGNLKRLEIARALATEPELLMLDEPFGGLSSSETDLMVESIRRLHLTVVLVDFMVKDFLSLLLNISYNI